MVEALLLRQFSVKKSNTTAAYVTYQLDVCIYMRGKVPFYSACCNNILTSSLQDVWGRNSPSGETNEQLKHQPSASFICLKHTFTLFCRPGAGQRKRGRSRHKGRSIDPARPCSSSQSSSSLSSPNETCYSFVRRALQVNGY